jgi:hypothetical protein
MTRIVIIGGGPAGYEAALVAAQLGAEVTVVERDGLGGASVLTDCVPSKTFIAAAGAMTAVRDSAVLGLQGTDLATVSLDLATVNQRIKGLSSPSMAGVLVPGRRGPSSASHTLDVARDPGRDPKPVKASLTVVSASGAWCSILCHVGHLRVQRLRAYPGVGHDHPSRVILARRGEGA